MKTVKLFAMVMMCAAIVFSGCGLKKMVKKQSQVTYSVNPDPMEAHGGKITMEIKGNYPKKYFSKKANLTIVPEVKAENGTTVKLNPIYLKGEKATGEGTTISYKNGGSFSSTQTVDYQPAFAVCTLNGNATATQGSKDATFDEIYFGEGTIATSERLATNPKLGYKKDLTDGSNYVLSDHEYTGQVISTATGMIYYELNKDNLDLNLALNKKDENKQALNGLAEFTGKYPEIVSVDIVGWASPEGELNRNQELSSNRSKTAQKWFENEYDKYVKKVAKEQKVKAADIKKDIKYNTDDKGEDWDGFLEAVAASNIKDKDQILNVIRSQADRDQKQQQIRNMIAIYNEIDDILPGLRRAIIKVNCTDAKTDAQIAKYASENPDSLTLSELLYSASLTEDLNKKTAIYEQAIKLYPDDYRAYNDLACVKASQGDYDAARELLDKANSLSPNNGIVLNNIGVLCLSQKNYDGARIAFAASEKAGFNQSYNMGILDMKEGNYSSAASKMSNAKCDYNVALNQILNKNYSDAKSTLNCISNKTAADYYLLAIVGARTNDANEVYTNLKSACKMDAKYKVEASKDAEFKKFRDNAEFQNAIK